VSTPRRESGQILVLFAGGLIALLLLAALAIDVAGVWAEARNERSIADAAALAGAQDTYRPASNTVDNTEWTNARTHAMQSVIGQLVDPGATLPTCGTQTAPYGSDIVNCPIAGTPFYVSIFAPATSCQSGGCDPLRSVQVTVRNPTHQLSLAHLAGQGAWNVSVTSVAERGRGANYAFVTLRPPKPSRRNDPSCSPNCDANENDILLDGTNTKLTVAGDMGTNTNLTLTSGAVVSLPDPTTYVYRYDAYKNWTGNPRDRQASTPVPDPLYAYPVPPLATDASRNFSSEPAARMTPAACQNAVLNMPIQYNVPSTDITSGAAVCYKPGAYNFKLSGLAGVKAMIFTPGVYFLNGGLYPGNNARVIGGYEPNVPGVAFVFKVSCNPDCSFTANGGTPLVALNAGAAYPTGTGTPAKAAVNWDGTVVQTNTKVPYPMTLLVQRDPACVVGPTEVTPCTKGQLKLPGGGSLFLFHVQYAPTDNVVIVGGSGSNGYLGQIWAWTVQYTGGSNINLIGVTNPEPGVLRLATPCSPTAFCDNPEAGAVIP
jgi:Putative Flp pilus-assembly TadE/G-like